MNCHIIRHLAFFFCKKIVCAGSICQVGAPLLIGLSANCLVKAEQRGPDSWNETLELPGVSLAQLL